MPIPRLTILALVPTLFAICLVSTGCDGRPKEVNNDPLSQQVNKAGLEYYGKDEVRVQPGETRSEETLKETTRQRALGKLAAILDQTAAQKSEASIASQSNLQGAGIDPKDKEAAEGIKKSLKDIGDQAKLSSSGGGESTAQMAGVAYLNSDWKDAEGRQVYGCVAYIHPNHIDQFRGLVNAKFDLLQGKLKQQVDNLSDAGKVQFQAALDAARNGMLKEITDKAAADLAKQKSDYDAQLAAQKDELAKAKASGSASKLELDAMQRKATQLETKAAEAEKKKAEAEAKSVEDAKKIKDAEEKAKSSKKDAGL
ncbi:hypothetical protein LBMAG53_40040 [Planctomycetota bacterium]|nr:hypothetical protein LBMAG53_40040 [Planctomycetota bacterium]